MYPDPLFADVDLYLLFILFGVLAALVCLRVFSGKVMPPRLFNFLLLTAAVTIVLGYLFAVLFQDVYHYLATREWLWNAGATFYGGLIGGAAVFFLFYFGVGHVLFKDKTHVRRLPDVVNIAVPSIVVAHGFGRIGCLMAGCCYGKVTDAWYGIHMYFDPEGVRRIPTQLFEALFLFALFAVLTYLLLKKRNRYLLSIYLISYGVWRFFIEFIRDDDARGSSGITGLWPSQVTAIVLVVVGIALIFLAKYFLFDLLGKAGGYEQKNES